MTTCRRVVAVLAAVFGFVTLGSTTAAMAVAPVTAKPTEGTGTVTATGRWIAESYSYTATMENTFTPARIRPGENFSYRSVM